MENQVYAPVLVTTICRNVHFKRCIESLSKCIDADKTELYIGVDYPANESHWAGYKKICDYLPQIKGFKNVIISMRPENWGQRKNTKNLREQISQKYDRYIITEDDNEFAPNFLLYMNQCLEKYKDNPKVSFVCGYSYEDWNNPDGYPFNAFPMQGFCAWGFGVWNNKRVEFAQFPSADEIIHSKKMVKQLFSKKMFVTVHRLLFRSKISGGDLRKRCYNVLEDKYCIFPVVSKVRNHGFDGDGSHCAKINIYSRQDIDNDDSFVLDDFEIKDYDPIVGLYNKHYAGGLLSRMLIRIEYFQWRFTGKAFLDYSVVRYIIKLRVKYWLNK